MSRFAPAGGGGSGPRAPEAFVGAPDSELPSPALCVDVDVAAANTAAMAAKAAAAGVLLRPHVKTHKTLEGAALQTAHTARGGPAPGIVVSTIAEARAFASSGYADVLYGVPVEPSKLPYLWELHMTPGLTLRVLLDGEPARALLAGWWAQHQQPEQPAPKPWSVYVKVDAGYRRAGVAADSDAAVALAAAVAAGPGTRLHGLYSHSGNSYNCGGGCASAGDDDGLDDSAAKARAAAAEIGRAELAALLALARRLASATPPVAVPVVSVGATPSTSATDYHAALAAAAGAAAGTAAPAVEVHPGNYIFYDRQQVASGSCPGTAHVAVYVLARVIGAYPARGEVLIDAGSCALHKDSGGLGDGTWGELADHPGYVLRRMTQEAAVVGRADGGPIPAELLETAFALGAPLRVLPNHSCMTAAGHEVYFAVRKQQPAAAPLDRDGGVPPTPPPTRTVTAVWRPVKFWY
jgi:D-serine deaminase-like pyridoxal phosphate-dependent protein